MRIYNSHLCDFFVSLTRKVLVFNLNYNITKNLKHTQVECSSCGSKMDLNELVIEQIINSEREKISNGFDVKLENALNKKESELNEKNKLKLEQVLKELEVKNNSISSLLEVKAENEKLKRDQDIMRKKMNLELEKAKTEISNSISKELEDTISQKYELRLAEKEKQIEQVKKSAEEAAKKARQGSMQIQGEIQEEAIEKWLLDNFHLDNILEVKKGQLGADCLQIVNEFDTQNCGKIYYESKNTKEFNNQWIPKFKKDIQSQNADIGVLVTQTMPKGMKRMGIIDGIYVCSFNEFKGLSVILRNTLIEFARHKIINENVEGKQALLYEFLTSKKFLAHVESIIDSFRKMNLDLEKEERMAFKNFEKRRSYIRLAQKGTVSLFTNFSSIAGSSIKNLDLLNFDAETSTSNVELLQRLADTD